MFYSKYLTGGERNVFKKIINTYKENIKNIDNRADNQDKLETYLNI